ncbi:MAG: tetratricopeptide repeat protein [Elusimicrobiota bacterium]
MKDKNLDKLSETELLDLRDGIDRRLKESAKRPVVKPGKTIELAVLAVQHQTVRCRMLDGGQRLTLRPKHEPYRIAEGQILTVLPAKQWAYKRTAYVSGEILDSRIDAPALGLTPLKLEDEWTWDPAEEYWGEPDEPVDENLKPIIAAGPRPGYVMEQILPGDDPTDPDTDPIGQAVDLYEAGDLTGSIKVLQKCLCSDLRVLDAHAHLGIWAFGDGSNSVGVEQARRHYEAGAAIGELSLGPEFRSVLQWGRINNRPFLRCLSGLGICHWALGDLNKAATVFRRILWLNPPDNQGARICLWNIERGRTYSECQKIDRSARGEC